MPQIMTELERYDVTAERKSIYADFQDMSDKLGIKDEVEGIGFCILGYARKRRIKQKYRAEEYSGFSTIKIRRDVDS